MDWSTSTFEHRDVGSSVPALQFKSNLKILVLGGSIQILQSSKIKSLPVIVAENMVLVIGGIFADSSANEAGGSVSDIMLLNCAHFGVFLDIIWFIWIFGGLLDRFGRFQVTLFTST